MYGPYLEGDLVREGVEGRHGEGLEHGAGELGNLYELRMSAGRACKVKNSEHFTRISSLILFVFTCKGVHMMA